MARAPKKKPLHIQRLIKWEYYERYSRKGWVTRNEFVNTTEYQFLSAGVKKDGLMVYYVRVD